MIIMKYEEQEKKLNEFIASGGDLSIGELDGAIVFTAHSRGWVKTDRGTRYEFMIGHDGSWWFKSP